MARRNHYRIAIAGRDVYLGALDAEQVYALQDAIRAARKGEALTLTTNDGALLTSWAPKVDA